MIPIFSPTAETVNIATFDIMKKILLTLYIFCLVFSFVGCSEEKVSRTVMVMDTVATIECYGDNAKEACDKAISEIQRIELLFSPWIETSEIYKINKTAHLSPVKTDPEVFKVLERCIEVSEITGGAFDITLKPLKDVWNMKSESPKVPSKEEIDEALSICGYENLVLKDGCVSFKKEGMALDLGGAVKGYAADRAAEVIKKAGVKNALIDIGGNVYALGESPKKREWKIGLQHPAKDRGEYFETIELSDKTCVTSGSYERYFEQDGKVYHHIMDPKTGYSADSGLVSVSVVGKSSFEADMASTAAFVMGQEKFLEVKDDFDIETFIAVDKTNNWKRY
ncbi:MAG: FAD:protein FMN transferase [Ruminococcaceae bacterium]|nr:FAD:protein FMN transferase [Oscillospiraceae bacterium]